MKKFLVSLLVVALIIGAGVYFFKPQIFSGPGGQASIIDALLAPAAAADLYEDQTTLQVTAGSVLVKRANGQEEKITGQTTLNPGDTIKVDKDSTAEIQWFDDSISRLKENTELTIEKAAYNPDNITETRISIRVVAGEVWNKVRSLVDRKSEFLTYTGNVVSGVRGCTYNVIVKGDEVTVESVAHAAFVAPYDPSTQKRGDEKRIVRGQRALITAKAKAPKVEKIPQERLKSDWVKGNRNQDKKIEKQNREKDLKRLMKRVGALPGEPGYKEKMKQIQNKLNDVQDPAQRAKLETRVADLQLRESVALALKDPSKASEVAPKLKEIKSSISGPEAQTTLKVLSRTMEEVLPDEKELYNLKESIREEAAALAPTPEEQKAAEEQNLQNKFFELSDTLEKPGIDPAPYFEQLKDYQQAVQGITDFWTENKDFQNTYLNLIKDVQADGMNPESIQKLQQFIQSPETQQRLQEAAQAVKEIQPQLEQMQNVIQKIQVDPNTINLLTVPAEDITTIKQLAPYYQGASGL